MNNVVSYLALAYVAQTVAQAAQKLIPLKTPAQSQLVREWLSTGAAVTLTFAAKMDILGDLGLELGAEPIGYVVTGIILGHGVQYALKFMGNNPLKSVRPASKS
ncbi:hypothetical protein [Sulfobacillus harzensis]|uniref:Uncharacterized protein n=1 Tax=Sulfobacillus harzensis TaxID=2729629 RepID=A0A7Y0Q3Q6_9FIRM|nr:hypothetical protein [Sulfobacillus harzensis]NMP24528.1 hypothetical protein [Sulfobacillus harzensis]